ncbi:MAG: PorT family protein [Bryobacteraceae bacterium]|nr:PorT family protein [Bryobacteraceae bacterium]
MRYVFFLLAATCLHAQLKWPERLEVGFKAGSALNDPASQTNVLSTYNQSRWTGGPTVELHLPFRFALEFDALYWTNRSTFNSIFSLGATLSPYSVTSQQKTEVWDLPLLLKYRFRVGSIRPFISAGYLFAHQSTNRSWAYQCQGPQNSCASPDFPNVQLGGRSEYSRFQSGPTAGAGLEFKTRYLRISPELRFSRLLYDSRDNRFTAMVGFTFGGKK